MLRDKYDAEEAVAQTFLKIINNIERISALPLSPNRALFRYNTEEEYLKTLDKEKLLSCVNKLSDDEKNLLYLRFVNEMKFKDIARLLGITGEAAKKRGQRILKKLRLYYEGGNMSAQNN
ncbi:MAG: sigma-70 family RNA polymerase sigma factor [Tissierellia bacterium]|nr:sigma-70 family RNA polymerase sigma factor [Tissierellia bacterium]